MRAATLRLSLLSLALAAGSSCKGSDSGLSVDGACTPYCDWLMDCAEVDPLNEDNFLDSCMTQCRDDNDYAEAQNPGDSECAQAFRHVYTCVASEAECSDIDTEFEGLCMGVLLDIAEHCVNDPFRPN